MPRLPICNDRPFVSRAGFRLVTAFASLALGTSAWATVALNKSFNPISTTINKPSTLTITLVNTNAAAATGVAFSDALPAGVVVATPSNASTTCGGTLTASMGATSVALSGGTIPAATSSPGTCVVHADVVASAPGTYVNTIAAGAVTSSQGTNTQDAQATYNVAAFAPVTGTKTYSPSNLHGNAVSRLTITLSNSNAIALTGVSVTDTLPAKLAVAATPNLATTCQGGTPTRTATSVTISGATIAANASCTISVDVTPSNPNVYFNNNNTDLKNVNNVIAAGSVTSDQGVSNTVFSQTLLVQTGARIQKTFAPIEIQSGATSTLTLQLQNFNATTMSPLNLIDNLPAGMSVAGTAKTDCSGATLSTTAKSVIVSGGSLPGTGAAVGPQVCQITVPVTGINSGASAITLINTIPAGSFGGEGYEVASGSLIVDPISLITGSKAFGPGVETGLLPLTITLNNASAVSASITNFNDDVTTMGTGFALAGPAPTTTCSGGNPTVTGATLTMTSGTIPAKGSCTISAAVRGPGGSTGNHINTIATGAVSTTQGDTAAPIRGTAFITPALTLSDSFQPSTVFAGSNAQLTVTFTLAAGASGLSGIALTDTLPAGLTIAASPAPVSTCGGSVTAAAGSKSFALSGGTLAGGSSATSCRVTVTVTTPNTAGQSTNSIPFGAVQSNERVTNNTQADATLQRAATPSLSKGFNPTVVSIGATSKLQIAIVNNGQGATTLTNGTLTDNLPAGMHVASSPNATFGGTGCSGGTIAANPGDATIKLSGATIGGGSTCMLDVDVVASFAGNLTNTLPIGSLTTTEGPTNTSSVSATLTASGNGDLSVTKSDGVTSVTAGTSVTYTVVFANAGPDDVAGAPISDDPPAGVTFTSWTCAASNGATCPASGSGPLTGTNVSIPKNGNVTFTVVAAIDASANGSISNTASITAPASVVDPVQSNNSATDTDQIAAQARTIDISKTADVSSVAAGGTINYTVTVTNMGAVAVDGTTVSDAMPKGVESQSWTCAATGGATCQASGTGAIDDTLNSFPAASKVTYTVTAVVNADPPSTIDNTATATAPSGGTCVSGGTQCTASVSTPVDITTQDTPQVQLTKTVNSRRLQPNGTLVYTVSLSNVSLVAATNVVVTDAVPGGIATFAWSCTASGGAACPVASGSGSLAQTIANLPAGGALVYTINATVTANPPGTVTNSASVHSSDALTCAPSGLTAPCTAAATSTVSSGSGQIAATPALSTWALLVLAFVMMAAGGFITRHRN